MPPILNHQQIIDAARIEDLFTHDGDVLKPSGKDRKTTCPFCGYEGRNKGISISLVKNLARCFKCEVTVTPGNYFQTRHNLTFPEAIKCLSDITKIPIEHAQPNTPPKKKAPQQPKPNTNPGQTDEKESPAPKTIETKLPNNGLEQTIHQGNNTIHIKQQSFCDKQLAASGLLVPQNLESEIKINSTTTKIIPRYTSGSIDDGGNIIPGDDMILHYVSLYRQRETYYKKKADNSITGQPITFTRVRYQYPNLHLDKYKKPKKYSSPNKSGCHVWHPELLIKKFTASRPIPHYHIQEGEKKADKATMHGIISSGIGGITMLADNQQLNQDFSDIITRCGVTNVYFWVDADWQDLGSDKNVAARSYMFMGAIRNFLGYFKAFYNDGIDLRLHLCYVNAGQTNVAKQAIKGIDDLLVHMAGNENLVLQDWEKARLEKDGRGQYISCIDISHYTENSLKKLFYLTANDEFFAHHHKELAQRKEFNFFKTPYIYDEDSDTFNLKQPITDDERWWQPGTARNNKLNFVFDFDAFQVFCANRYVGRLSISQKPKKIKLIRADVNTKTLNFIAPDEVALWVFEFLDTIGEKAVKNYYHLNDQIFEEKKLMRLWLLDSTIKIFSHNKHTAYLFFTNGFWQINSSGITLKTIKDSEGYIWETQVKEFEPTLITDTSSSQLIRLTKTAENKFSFIMTPEAEKCHFLTFLYNTGNFYKYIPEASWTLDQSYDILQHLANKLSAIGYLLHEHFDAANTKSVVLMDAERPGQSDGESYGRSGKSIVADLFKELVAHVIIDGKKPDIDTDKHLFSEVDERTRLVIFDDIRKNFDFESLLSKITGNMSTRAMYQTDTKIAKANTPKFLITTNHSIRGATNNSSFEDRIFYCVFSDFYNKDHKPIQDFHQRFFDDWEYEQWNLTYNLIACCQQIYMEHGLIEAPGSLHIQKQQRGEIGDNFMDYCNEYWIEQDYDIVKERFTGRFEVEVYKHEFYDAYHESRKGYKYAYKDRTFWQKFRMWVAYHGFTCQGLDKDNRIQRTHQLKQTRMDVIVLSRAKEVKE